MITYQARDLTVLGPVQTPKRITIEVGLFYKWASYLLVSKYSLQMEFWRIEFFYPWEKIYISAKKFGWRPLAGRQTSFKQLLSEVFLDIRNNQGRGNCYQLSRRPRLITLTKTLIIRDTTKPESLYIVLKKIRANTASHGTVWHSSWKSCIACATYRLVAAAENDKTKPSLRVQLNFIILNSIFLCCIILYLLK